MVIFVVVDDVYCMCCFDSGMDGVFGKLLCLVVLCELIEFWCGYGDFDFYMVLVEYDVVLMVDILVIY